jgi:hypothetical protein
MGNPARTFPLESIAGKFMPKLAINMSPAGSRGRMKRDEVCVCVGDFL